jgi:transmembrane sensor
MQQLPVDRSLLQLYMNGECSKEQLAIIREYLHNPAYQESLQQWLKMDWQQVTGENYEQEEKSADKFRQFLALVQTSSTIPAEPIPVRKMQARRWWQVAAAAVLVIGVIGWISWQWKQQQQAEQLAMLEQEMVQFHNEAGKRTRIVLPDSTQVYLNAASHLQYNKNFGKTNRNITLDGEAFFIVKHGKEFPFSVRSGSITTVDIGTAFNIRYRKSDPVVYVAVAEGAVNVMDHQKTSGELITLLTQQQQLNFDARTGKATVQQLPDTESIGGWRQGMLSFHAQPLKEVVRELERFYGISIRFANSETGDMLITTTIRNATANEALDIIALTAGVHLERSATEILIK